MILKKQYLHSSETQTGICRPVLFLLIPYRKIDRETAEFLNKVVNLNLVYSMLREWGITGLCLT